MNKDANAMNDEFTLVYELRSDMGAQDEVLRHVAGSECADATVGLGRRGISLWSAAAKRLIVRQRWLLPSHR
jgi:hypothetical protein